jgi:hypothetical protein
MIPMIAFAAKVQHVAREMLGDSLDTKPLTRQFVEHMVIVGMLDVEGDVRMEAQEVVSQVRKAVSLGVWEIVA